MQQQSKSSKKWCQTSQQSFMAIWDGRQSLQHATKHNPPWQGFNPPASTQTHKHINIMKHTFEQGYIQSDITGQFHTSIVVNARCRAFTKDIIRDHHILISADRSVSVWDCLAGHFTTCHTLSKATALKIIRKHIRN